MIIAEAANVFKVDIAWDSCWDQFYTSELLKKNNREYFPKWGQGKCEAIGTWNEYLRSDPECTPSYHIISYYDMI